MVYVLKGRFVFLRIQQATIEDKIMINKMKKLKREEGQAMVLFAIVMVLVMGFAALVIDLGMAKVAESQMQNAADAAAMAAVGQLPDTTAASNAALIYAQLNGVDVNDVIITTPYDGDAAKIEIVCQKTVEYTFANMLGFENTVVSARAVASKGAGGAGGAFDYAIFGGSTTQQSNIYGASSYVEGDIHSNNDYNLQGAKATIIGSIEATYNLFIGGSNMTIEGDVQAANISINGNKISTGSQIPVSASYVEMPDLSAITSEAIANAGYAYMGYTGFHGSDVNITDSTYVDGYFQITGSNVSSSGALMASGDIMVTGAKMVLTGEDGIALYSANGSIYLHGSNPEIHGLIYAPNGNVIISGANTTIYGQIIAQRVDLQGSGVEIYYDDSYQEIIGIGDTNQLAE